MTKITNEENTFESKNLKLESIQDTLNNNDLIKPLWNPTQSLNINQETKLRQFQALIELKYKQKFENYNQLHKWSCDNFILFWQEFFHFSNIIYTNEYKQVLDKPDGPMDNLPFKWFDGALLNHAENLLNLSKESDKVAVYSFGEAFKQIKSLTFRELKDKVKLYQISLRQLGIKKNDVVVGYLPNCIEALVAKLACNSLGAIWSCASPDFGSSSVLERFRQIRPKLLFSVTSLSYNGKKHDHKSKLIQVVDGLDTIEKCILVPFYNDEIDEFSDIPKRMHLDDFLNLSKDSSYLEKELEFEQVEFYHPLVILFSSGTTGIPKCIVHSHGGTLIQHLKEHLLHGNMNKDDIIFYYTTTGWMMFDWLISSLAVGASVVLYDGSPFIPNINVLWDLVDRLNITMFGTSAKWLSVIEEKNCQPKQTHKLDSLKIIYSTGSPLKPSSYDYVYNSIKSDLVLGSITGGSDIISLFCGCNLNLPIYRGEIQCRQLGMSVECWNELGQAVYDECGDLVCTKPFPSMPVYFFDDSDFKKYKSSYLEKFQGVWAHGDFCMINSHTGGVQMLGRSDGTLNPNGVRFGSADIYHTIENLEEIEDSLCVGQKNAENPAEERVVLFLKLKSNVQYNQSLVDKVKAKIRESLSPRHVPNVVLPIEEIPYTLNGKKVEVPVRKIIEGVQITPSSSLVNPKCLDFFKNIEALKKW